MYIEAKYVFDNPLSVNIHLRLKNLNKRKKSVFMKYQTVQWKSNCFT